MLAVANAGPCAPSGGAGEYTGVVRAVALPTICDRIVDSATLSCVGLSAK